MYINETTIFYGIISAVIFACVVLFARENQNANRFLAFLILALGYNLFCAHLLIQGSYAQFPTLNFFPYFISFGLGPLLFLYVQSLCMSTKPKLTHLWWLLADYPHSFFHLTFGRDLDNTLLHEVLDKLGFLSVIVSVYYFYKSYQIIKRYHNELPDKLSNVEHQRLRWLNQLGLLFMISLPIAIIFWTLLVAVGIDFDDRLPIYVFNIITIFWLGIGGVRQHELVAKNISSDPEVPEEKTSITHNPAHLKILTESMQRDKLYLLPDLNVRYLEDRLNLTAKQISEALNQGLNKNFYTFINEYRVEEFKRRVKSETKLTLAGIAMECGFNSKATFQRVFKEITGMKPSEFVDKANN